MSRLFHALVVFGAGATLSGCGGRTSDSTNIADPNGSGAGGAGAGGAGAGGAGAGGAGAGGAGGIFSSGGRIAQGGNPATGGTVGTGGAMLPDPPTLAQWGCETLFQGCTDLNTAGGTTMRFLLDSPCPIDPKRPRTPADCTGWFECDLASFQGTPVAVDCHCVPVDPNGCKQPSGLSPCDALTSQPWYRLSRQTDSCADPVRLCDCAITGILR